jgi:hypothetical protein
MTFGKGGLKLLAPSSEFNHQFTEMMDNRMAVSYHKYGPVALNYGTGLCNAMENLKKRLDLYERTGNTEYLVDVANFARIEYTYPQHPSAHFDNLSESPGIGKINAKEIEEMSR